MIWFWTAAAVMTVLAVGLLVLPFLIKREAANTGRADFDITVYKDQLAEVSRDLDRGLLDETQAEAARTEIERRMLAAKESDTEAAVAPAKTKGLNRALMALVLLAVPLGATALYLAVGNYGQEDMPLASRKGAAQDMASAKTDMESMVRQLEQNIKASPDDPNAWALLGQGYQALGRFEDAVKAFEILADLTGRHPEALVMQVEAMLDVENGIISIPMKDMLEEAKAKDPNLPGAYYYLAVERQQHNDLEGAMAELVALLERSPADAPWVPQVQEIVVGIAAEMGVEPPKVSLLPPSQPVAPAIGPNGPTPEQMQSAGDMSAEDQNTMIRSMVDRLAGRLAENPDDLDGWIRLERAYQVLGDADKAAEARAQIERLQAK